MRNLTAEAIAEVGPINQVLTDVLVDLEGMEVRNQRIPLYVEAVVRSAIELIVPGTCYRRVFWISRDLMDATDTLERFRYDDLSTRVKYAAQMASTLLEGGDD